MNQQKSKKTKTELNKREEIRHKTIFHLAKKKDGWIFGVETDHMEKLVFVSWRVLFLYHYNK